jgi:hypothetical protein
MITHYPKTVDAGGPRKDEKIVELQSGADKDDACRCKAASKMSPGQLVKLMVSDLAFWKKAKKG